ncbi:DNA-directed RNA polymerase core subunit rpc40 [Tilletia horrida]|uniref:DNA-directed RNA polymerases I and III subunit RPAC1 n=1 Tax=Tilletia horrida TaxID=155126 RepID=A0AAN6JN42_9BASI|nr:DNA-directed RNA polymerase core subunit rpc40 [Tilletia horrida]
MHSPSNDGDDVHPARLVGILPERVANVSAPDLPYHFPASSSAANALAPLSVRITRLSPERIEFDLVGVDASIANALRRILIAECPSIAIEHCYVFQNTSIVQDEVLAHRLGLVPLKIPPHVLHFKAEDEEGNDTNTVVFYLESECTRNPAAKKGETDPDKLYIGSNVTSGQLQWSPRGGQEEDFAGYTLGPVQPDILLAKLRPGQTLNLELHCEKGIGKDHAKFSPVCPASYRLLPRITILPPGIPPHLATKFQKCFPKGVIGIRKHAQTGEDEAYVADPRKDTVSREVLRHKEFEGLVKLDRVRDHFLFEIESTGVYEPENLLPTAIDVMLEKIRTVRRGVDELIRREGLQIDAMQI